MLLDDIRQELAAQGYTTRTRERMLGWIKRYIAFHDQRHPAQLGGEDLNRFLMHLSPVAQVPALRSVAFLYTQVLGVDIKTLGWPARLLDPELAPSLWERLKAACHEAVRMPEPVHATARLSGVALH